MVNKNESNVYCTIFDSNYLARALALHASLMRVNEASRFAFFCIDDRSADLLDMLQLERSTVIRHEEFTTPELLMVRPHRSQGEYCWTCKPAAILYVMKRLPNIKWVVYVDTDMMFFSDPDAALPGESAHYLLTPHRFHGAFVQFEQQAGKHNAGYVAARNSVTGQQVIEWWRDQCISRCSSIPTESSYADQKYLDQFRLQSLAGESSNHIGLNAAPWNIESYRVTVVNGFVKIDETPLLLYHFQSLQLFDDGKAALYTGNRRIPDDLRATIYDPYLAELQQSYLKIRAISLGFSDGLLDRRRLPDGVVGHVLAMLRRRRNLVSFNL